MFQGNSSSSDLSQRSAGQIDDIMVKDPVCEAYLAKKEGILFKFNGENLYFCSTDCRDKFIAEQSENENNAR
jgi:YHS domain-containing protein